jgi:hypothetical protein
MNTQFQLETMNNARQLNGLQGQKKTNVHIPPMKKPHGLHHRALFIYTATTYSPTNLWQYHQR